MTASSSKSKMLCKEFAARSIDMLQAGQLSDCSFLVGPESNRELVSANKVILALTSEYFHAMFYGNITEKNEPIFIPDVYPVHFKKLLNYIYTSKMQISSLDEANALYYCAKQFLLPHLQQLCSEFLTHTVDASNVCHIYECAELYEDDTLKDKVTEIFTDATKLVLQDSSFEEVKLSTLLHIFSLNKLCIDSEIDLLEAAMRYNDAQGNAMSLKENEDILKLPIQRAIEKIRFLTVSPKQFSESPARKLFLSDSEALAILLNISSNNTDEPYPSRLCNSRESRIQTERSKTFSFAVDITQLKGNFLSARHYICNFPWRIMASIYSDEQMEKYLSVFLICAPKSSSWKCLAECELRLCSQISDIVRKHTKEFSKDNKAYYYGLSKFVSWRDVLDPNKGYTKDGSVTLRASVTVREYSYD